MENLLLSCIESRVENNRNFYGRFQLGPFDLGQGLTVATALRRTLLSELTGLAITAVAIQGVSHEYSTIRGVRESVLDILLNLKQIVFTNELTKNSSSILSQEVSKSNIGFLKVNGPGVVTARDIRLSPLIQCVDPDQYIATLSFNGTLEIRFLISEGNNYIIQKKPSSSLAGALFQTSNSTKYLNSLEDSKSLLNFESNFLETTTNSNQNNNNIANYRGDNNSSTLQIQNKIIPDIKSKNNKETRLVNSKIISSNFLEETPVNSVKQAEQTKNKVENIDTFSNKKLIEKPDLGSSTFLSNQDSTKIPQTSFLKKGSRTNVLLIDAVFMPVTRVNFLLEQDDESLEIKEKIILEIWTNGSIHPRKAIHEAALSLIKIFLPFQELDSLKNFFTNLDSKNQEPLHSLLPRHDLSLAKKKVKFAAKRDNLAIKKNRASIDIGNLELSLRPYTCLKRANINTINDLLQYSADELLLLKNFGKRSLEEVEATLAQLGLKLGKPNLL